MFKKGIITVGIILFAVYMFFACTKTTTKVPIVTTQSSIAAIIKNGTNLTILDSILKKTGYNLTLDSTGPFTFFAATDPAFNAIGFTDSTIYKAPVSYLTRLVRYNFIYGLALTSSELPQGINAPYPSASPGDTIYVTTDSAGVYINGSLIAQSNILAKNGYIQSVQNVLFPPNGSVLQTLQNLSLTDTTLTILDSALNYASAGMGAASLDSLLSSGGTHTIFAPTNNAFRAFFGDTTTVSFVNYTADSLISLLNRHIVNGRYFTSDFTFGKTIPTLLAGDSVKFSPFYPNVIIQKDSVSTSNIIATNILSTNGVIHKINAVLVP